MTTTSTTKQSASTGSDTDVTHASTPAPTLTTEADHEQYVTDAERAVAELEARILEGDETAGHAELASLLVQAEARTRFAELSLEGFKRRQAAKRLADRTAAASVLAADVRSLAKEQAAFHDSDSPAVASVVTAVTKEVAKYLVALEDYSARAGELIERADSLGVVNIDSRDPEHVGLKVDGLYRNWRSLVAPEGDKHWGIGVQGSIDRDAAVQWLLQLVRAQLPDQL